LTVAGISDGASTDANIPNWIQYFWVIYSRYHRLQNCSLHNTVRVSIAHIYTLNTGTFIQQ